VANLLPLFQKKIDYLDFHPIWPITYGADGLKMTLVNKELNDSAIKGKKTKIHSEPLDTFFEAFLNILSCLTWGWKELKLIWLISNQRSLLPFMFTFLWYNTFCDRVYRWTEVYYASVQHPDTFPRYSYWVTARWVVCKNLQKGMFYEPVFIQSGMAFAWIKGCVPHLLGNRYHSMETFLDLLSDRVSAYWCMQTLRTEKGRGT